MTSVSTPDDEVSFAGSRVAAGAYCSRSQAVSAAIKAWRTSQLEEGYRRAFEDIDSVSKGVVAGGLADQDEAC